MPTATAQATANITFIKYWGKVTEIIAVATGFYTIFRVQKQGITSIETKTGQSQQDQRFFNAHLRRNIFSLDEVVALDTQLN